MLGISKIRPSLGGLSARGVAFLQFPGRGEISPIAGALTTPCHGEIEASDSNLAGQHSSGLRIAGGLRERGDVLLVTDADARIRGLAREAPLVSYGRAYANDFVWAVLTHLVRQTDRTRQSWRGFSDRGSGPPYTAELLGADGRVVCTQPIACCSAPPPVASPRLIVGADVDHR